MTQQDQRATFEGQIELPPLPKFDRLSSMHADDVERRLRAYGRKCARAAIAHDRRRIRNRVRDRAIAGAALVKDFLAIVDDGDYGAHDRQQPAEPTIKESLTVAEPVKGPSDEQAEFTKWAEVEYRNEPEYTARDYRMGLDAWRQRARYGNAAQTTANEGDQQ